MLNLIKDLGIHAGLTASILVVVNLESVSALLSVIMLVVSIAIGLQQIYMNRQKIRNNFITNRLNKKRKHYEENKIKLNKSKVLEN
ncbi:hypothetical protein [uncultured Mediterranean phage uvDeep-CGR2-KM19-C269]|nr:hypothetical protein [uncultured Mediterranean phage uvDeep-CGR2-KM19-C269]